MPLQDNAPGRGMKFALLGAGLALAAAAAGFGNLDTRIIAAADAQTATPPKIQGSAATTDDAVQHTVKAFQDQSPPPPPAEKSPVIQFASAVMPGEHPGPGEFIRTIRPFAMWTLICDTLTGKRQVCFLEQQVKASDGVSLTWQIAQTADGHVMMVMKAPSDISQTDGLKISFGGFERTERGLRCDSASCVLLLPFEGRVAEWITSEPTVTFALERNGKPYALIASMDGFKQAVDAIPKGETREAVADSGVAGSSKGRAVVYGKGHAIQPSDRSSRLQPLAYHSATGTN